MYNEQLEQLIDYALADGELTEKEKQVLFKKAETMGVDLDEFEMVLEARLFERRKKEQNVPTENVASPKSSKYGDVRKCPSCGAMVQSFQTRCSDCGYEFSNVASNSSIQKLFKMLDDVEAARKEKSVGGTVLEFFAKSYGLSANKTDSRKKEIIKNFPVPTTKEDILEFLSLAIPNAKKQGNFLTAKNEEYAAHNEFVPVWKAKCEQIIVKARFAMKDDKETLEQINKYAQELKIK